MLDTLHSFQNHPDSIDLSSQTVNCDLKSSPTSSVTEDNAARELGEILFHKWLQVQEAECKVSEPNNGESVAANDHLTDNASRIYQRHITTRTSDETQA